MNNLYAIGLILFGTYFGSQVHQDLTVDGEYHWQLAAVLAVTMYGALALADLAMKGLKVGFVLGKHYLGKTREWLK